ncbi:MULTISPECIES: DUF4860 domain-containing protein [unclassified Fusibacter]|uniref:DUF4860 domain-containing protein n=1 Tax=unclassified Fusibacter TaxID=2624464 RepID=UPI0013E956C1|nr:MULTISPECIES: DUF4860 domain-containing protein [unclassified Fusibacter]MCK8061380.1 DUF4860 domain-containing protein [Fusibacter sp. A2]NPE23577.1 DUF4860 domain-containing protein [Fusibacter sp. A1]
MSGRRKNVSIESFLVIILMMIFATAVCILIVQGSATFERALEKKTSEENLRIAMSYINMSIKQNDSLDSITLTQNAFKDSDALKLSHGQEEQGLVTYIFYYDGYLYECYTDTKPSLELSTPIVKLDGMTISSEKEGGLIVITYNHLLNHKEVEIDQRIALRTGD